jgi:hypothetical protein
MILAKKAKLETSILISLIKNRQFNYNLNFHLHTSLINKNNAKSLIFLAKKNIYNKKNDDFSNNLFKNLGESSKKFKALTENMENNFRDFLIKEKENSEANPKREEKKIFVCQTIFLLTNFHKFQDYLY